MLRKGPSDIRQPKYTLGPRHHHEQTCLTRPQQPSQNGRIYLANSICHLLPHPALTTYLKKKLLTSCVRIRLRKPRFGSNRTSDTIRCHEAPTAMGRTYTDESDCKTPSASCVGDKYTRTCIKNETGPSQNVAQDLLLLYNCYSSHSTVISCNIHIF